MSFKKHINQVTEKFFLATNMPIQAFQYDGNLICSKGYNNNLSRLFDSNDIYEKLKFKFLEAEDDKIVTMDFLNGVYFTICFICPRNVYRGLFILGPYSSSKNNSRNITYKPISLIPYLVSLLHMIFKDCSYRQKEALSDKVYSLHVKKAIDYIDARYKDDIALVDICDYLKINKSYFCSIFKKETGKTFTQFLNNIRIEKSKSLLLQENCSILDVALAVGFNNQNYYNIIFKKITNKTPLEFRNNANS